MNANKRGVSGVETRHVSNSSLFRALARWLFQRSATALEKIRERFVRLLGIHFLENVVDVIPKSASSELAVLYAPGLPFHLANFNVCLVKKFPYFRRFTVDEFGSELNGTITSWIDVGEHAPANTIAGFKDLDSNAGPAQLARSSQPCHASANDDHRRI
jgi:hypothetical protein